MKNKQKKKTFLLAIVSYFASIIVLSDLFQLIPFAAQTGHIEGLKALSMKCFKTNKVKACRYAIQKTESFQLYAGFREDYFCQTRLLGLQADLIMAILGKKDNYKNSTSLEEIEKLCHSNHF